MFVSNNVSWLIVLLIDTSVGEDNDKELPISNAKTNNKLFVFIMFYFLMILNTETCPFVSYTLSKYKPFDKELTSTASLYVRL